MWLQKDNYCTAQLCELTNLSFLRNSWVYDMPEVPLQELLQVLTINSVAPFILTSQLKPMLLKSPNHRKFVVNVSAMEGQFSRIHKGHRHAHTNMAKAALNMMTRTCGLEFEMDNIYMTSVDTGKSMSCAGSMLSFSSWFKLSI